MNNPDFPAPAGACLNCGQTVADTQKFCGACGQRTSISQRLSMRDIGHDLAHAITHADHSIFSLMRSLMTRPGHVAREYTEGKRKRHFGPFAFLIITVGLASAIIILSGVQWFQPYGHGKAAEILQRHVNLVILLQTPLLALCCAMLFLRDRRNFAEHLVLAAYTSGFHTLFLAVVETPTFALSSTNTADPVLAASYFVLWLLYFAFAASQFYRSASAGQQVWASFKGAMAVLASQALTVALLMAFLFLLSAMLAGH